MDAVGRWDVRLSLAIAKADATEEYCAVVARARRWLGTVAAGAMRRRERLSLAIAKADDTVEFGAEVAMARRRLVVTAEIGAEVARAPRRDAMIGVLWCFRLSLASCKADGSLQWGVALARRVLS